MLLLLAACGPNDVVLTEDDTGKTPPPDDTGEPTDDSTDPTPTDSTPTDSTEPTDGDAVDDDGDGLSEDEGDCDDALENWTTTCPWVQVSVGYANACGVRKDGELDCWGSDYYAVDQPPEGAFRSVSVSYSHACAVRDDGGVTCWGTDQGYGAVADPEGSFTAVDAGSYSNCGVLEDGDVACWGYGYEGTEVVYAAESYVEVAVTYYSICALSTASTVRCESWYGGFGDFDGSDYVDMDAGYVALALGAGGRVDIQGDAATYGLDAVPEGTWVDVSTYSYTACAVDELGHAACWGDDSYGQGSPPSGEFGFQSISVGSLAGCALTDDGNVLCWGYDGYGGEGP